VNLTVGTTAVPIPLESAPRGPRWSQGKLLVVNLGDGVGVGGIVYLGRDSDLTAETGYPIPAGEELDLPLDQALGGLYLISDRADTDVRYFV